MNTHSKKVRAARVPRRMLAGFTLVEMLVAVIAVSLLTVGIVQVFRATTRTVAAGRKLSNILTYANILERQLREDVNRMSRQGVLVIRHANTDRPVQVSPGDTSPRPRRVDELVFFAEGRFTSVRDPVNPGVQAEAAAARIYYGHGLRQEPRNAFDTPPSLTDTNQGRSFGDGANQFASDWILARHVTLMVPPRNSDGLIPDPNNPTTLRLPEQDEFDSVIQIGQQPAAPHIFDSVRRNTTFNNAQSIRSNELGGGPPDFASGLVDIAACDIADVRSFLLSGVQTRDLTPSAAPVQRSPVAVIGGDANAAGASIRRVQSKLKDLFPVSYSDASTNGGTRIRVEPAPPNPLGIGFPAPANVEQGDARRTDQRVLASHAFIPHCTEMIIEWSFGESVSASSSLAGTIPANQVSQLRWYGLRRGLDPFVPPAAVDPNEAVADSYSVDAIGREIKTALFFNTVNPVVPDGEPVDSPRKLTVRYFPAPEMFEDENAQPDQSFSFFGLVDPTWPPAEMFAAVPPREPPPPTAVRRLAPDSLRRWDFVDLTGANIDAQLQGSENVTRTDPSLTPDNPFNVLSRDVNRNGAYEPNLGERLNYPATLPWKWPRLLRITVTLADPIDPSFERTFQFILDLPADPTAQRN
ncbi:MAG: hypothetical protein K2X32_03575 [Phycisphaerales bacterium]|nr:hypothetical protein [Phycisphaerales bacterium]